LKIFAKQLGYDGLVISDALNMHSVSKLFDKKGSWNGKLSMLEMTCCALLKMCRRHSGNSKNANPERIEISYSHLMKCKIK
jgi:hypothetical protein